MEITLSPRLTKLVEQQIASGQYESIDELFEVALSLLAKRDQYDQWVREVGEKIDVGIQQLDRGEGVDGETAISQLRQRLAERQG
jgi:antitoxin ParD1/3/4